MYTFLRSRRHRCRTSGTGRASFPARSARAALAAAAGLALFAGPLGTAASAAAVSASPTWSSLSPPTSPPGVVNAVAAYDSADSTVVMFGGRLADGALSDQTWVWNGSVWSQPEQYVASPPPRQSASMGFDTALEPPQLILFGGRGDHGVLLDDTWTWNGSSWNRVATSSSPGAREGAAMTADAHGDLLLFGGYGITTDPAPSASTTSSTHPPTTAPRPSATTSRPSSTTSSTGPPTTSAPTASSTSTPSTAAPGTESPTTQTSTTQTSTTRPSTTRPSTTRPSTTRTPTTASAAGPARSGTLDAAVATPQVLDDTWILSSDDGVDEWRQVSTTSHPPPTTDASMATGSSGQTVLFGGTGRAPGRDQAGGTGNRTWVWNGRTWSTPEVGASPPARQDAGLAADAGVGATVLFGGLGPSGALDDTWLWGGSTWQRVAMGSAPSPRAGAAVAYDADSFQLIAFGGASTAGEAMSSTEVLSTQAPTAAPPPGTSPSSSTSSSTVRSAGASPRSSTSSSSPASVATGRSTHPARVTRVYRGGLVLLRGSGFLPRAEITITFHSATITVARSAADATGSFRVDVAVPTQVPFGNHHFEASGMGPHGRTNLITPVRVVARPAHRTSLTTELTLVAIAAAIPLLSWAVLSLFGRRRRQPVAA
jgi:hypothetical protein